MWALPMVIPDCLERRHTDFQGLGAYAACRSINFSSVNNFIRPLLGSLATVGALGYGLWCFRLGRSQMSQYMMRARVVAQGFTLVALLIGVSINATQGPKDDKK
uniref:HIG1 domain-containing protein n=1 Tax=Timema poppense TaxID=170557 RepID=A0A7R9CXA9_TIMPO|nr:unnamed protein product [Timema poppensis]